MMLVTMDLILTRTIRLQQVVEVQLNKEIMIMMMMYIIYDHWDNDDNDDVHI